MKNIVKLFAIAALSTVIVAGIAGCGSSSSSSSANSASASASAASASTSSAASSAASASASASSAAASAGEVASGSSAAAGGSQSGDWGRGDAAPAELANAQRLGSSKTGYVSVPSDWKDFTSKLDSHMVDANSTVYLVDPTTEFTSGVESHFAYASSITLETFPCKYTDKADELLYKYRGETTNYTEPSIEKTTFNGYNASVITCSSADNVEITNIAIEKDANACILITAWGTSSTNKSVLDYVSTWSMDK